MNQYSLSSNAEHTALTMNPEAIDDTLSGTSKLGYLEVGKTLDELIDLTAYNELAKEADATMSPHVDFTDVLPFEVYEVDYKSELYNPNSQDEISKVVLSGNIYGNKISAMIIKMDNASTYDILVRIPYYEHDIVDYCYCSDLGNFRVIAMNLTEEEVGEMVSNTGYLFLEYFYLLYELSTPLNDKQMLGDYINTQIENPKYFIFNSKELAYEELTEENRILLLQCPRVYVYFGLYPMPQEQEEVVVVETRFDEFIVEIPMDEMLEAIQRNTIISRSKFIYNFEDIGNE